MKDFEQAPSPFLEVRCTYLYGTEQAAVCLCAGYEAKAWRGKKLAQHIFQWLPFVALDQTERRDFTAANFMEKVKRAAYHVYKTAISESRGEIGEILLHIACVQEFGTLPVLCKLVLKSSANDTVKGFDSVHVVPTDDQFELWLGESKFYKNPKRAIADAVTSITDHLLPAFLDTEKAMIYGHIPEGIEHETGIRRIFSDSTSSDELLKISVFPVLIAYESSTVKSNSEICDEYQKLIETELGVLTDTFAHKAQKFPVRIQLVFVPLNTKQEVLETFDALIQAHS